LDEFVDKCDTSLVLEDYGLQATCRESAFAEFGIDDMEELL
jgi:hypothetical protein